ncbi:hypothetical protein [Streptomyces sp. NPDC058252]|uniref:hypothetical protein n=1 Tax=Streptomyces sp. NPDC058252 TaxID=3346405 RepID=UPI0036E5B49D
MAAKTITRPQYDALRTAELYDGEVPPSGTPLIDRYLVSARPATARVLLRLGLVEEIVTRSGIDAEEHVFPVLTHAGELLRVGMERGGRLTRLDHVARWVANAGERPERRPAVATYYPSEEGCRTWREAETRPFKINGERVSAVVEAYGTRITLFVGGRIVFEGAVPAEVRTSADVNTWARRAALAEVPEGLTEWERDLLATVHPAPAHGLEIVTTDELLTLLEPAPAAASVYVTTEAGERIEYAHVPNGDPARVAHFLTAARAVPTFRDVSTTR